jgi:hypothetical protein
MQKLANEFGLSDVGLAKLCRRHDVAAATDLPEDSKHDLQAMVEWIIGNADYVDPLTDLKWTLGQFKNPSCKSF